MADIKGVIVLGESESTRLSSITPELLGCGRKLADNLGEELACVLFAENADALAKEAIWYGADKVYIGNDPILKDYQAETYVPLLVELAIKLSPRILLIGQTDTGRDLAPRVAFRLSTALCTDCVDLTIDATTKQLLQTKPVYGGNALATFVTNSFPQTATVRQKVMQPAQRNESRTGDIVSIPVGLEASKLRTKTINRVKDEGVGVRLEDAAVVVSGGRGIGGAEGFNQLAELARLLKGTVGASRPPCDNGWVSTTLQVGLTGKIVAPELYISVGISGASQHLAGCSSAKTIVAINRDPEANIFKQARFGAIGDWKQILPALIDKVRELKTE